MARKFLIDKEISEGEEFVMEGEEARHVLVLRHNMGEKIQINDKICEILKIDKLGITCKAVGVAESIGVPKVKVDLFQALLKADKMELVIQKSVELGVNKIIPFESKNIVAKFEAKDKMKKVERWNKISKEATKQCGRSDIVEVGNIRTEREMTEELSNYDMVLFAYEKETESLKKVIAGENKGKKIAIIIGPEGGFDENEAEAFAGLENVSSISLGERILRAETASMYLLSVIMYEMGEN